MNKNGYRRSQKTADGEEASEDCIVFVSHLEYHVTQPDLYSLCADLHCGLSEGLVEIRLVRNIRGEVKGYAYFQYETNEKALRAVPLLDGQPFMGQKVRAAMSKPTKPMFEEKKLFIRGLPDCVTSGQIRDALSGVEIKEIRIVKHSTLSKKSGNRPKDPNLLKYVEGEPMGENFELKAYLDFETQGETERCFALETFKIGETEIELQRSQPMLKHGAQRANAKAAASCAKEYENNQGSGIIADTVIIKNIGFDIDEPKLREFIEGYAGQGTVLQCVIPLYKNNHSRGFAYVQFSTTDAALKSLQADDAFLNDRQIWVSQSTRKISQPGSGTPVPIKKRKFEGGQVSQDPLKRRLIF